MNSPHRQFFALAVFLFLGSLTALHARSTRGSTWLVTFLDDTRWMLTLYGGEGTRPGFFVAQDLNDHSEFDEGEISGTFYDDGSFEIRIPSREYGGGSLKGKELKGGRLEGKLYWDGESLAEPFTAVRIALYDSITGIDRHGYFFNGQFPQFVAASGLKIKPINDAIRAEVKGHYTPPKKRGKYEQMPAIVSDAMAGDGTMPPSADDVQYGTPVPVPDAIVSPDFAMEEPDDEDVDAPSEIDYVDAGETSSDEAEEDDEEEEEDPFDRWFSEQMELAMETEPGPDGTLLRVRIEFITGDLVSGTLKYVGTGDFNLVPDVRPFTFRIKGGKAKRLALRDLFVRGTAYMETIAAKLYQYALETDYICLDLVNEGFHQEEDFHGESFMVTEHGLLIRRRLAMYPCPYAAVLIPYDELRDIIDPKGPLARFVTARK